MSTINTQDGAFAISDETLAKSLFWPKEKNMASNEKDNQINFELDPDLKRRFKAFCALKDVTIKDCLTTYVEKCVDSVKKK